MIDRVAGQVFNVGGGPTNTISIWPRVSGGFRPPAARACVAFGRISSRDQETLGKRYPEGEKTVGGLRVVKIGRKGLLREG